MGREERVITPDEVLDMADYEATRKERRTAVSEIKRHRRIEVGPFATFYFESYDTMWYQVHEMLYIEHGGAEQIEGELAAYNPLIPQGWELVATLMLEISDPARRDRILATLGGIEHTSTMSLAGEAIAGLPRGEGERTNEAGKTSSVHFLYFPFTAEKIAKFHAPGTRITLGFAHEAYGHIAVVPEAVRQALAADFDEAYSISSSG